VNRINVSLHKGNELLPVGELAYKDNYAYFQYAESFLDKGLHLSPYQLDLNNELQKAERDPFNGLHGVFADSLPDGWGLLLMDRFFQSKGINLATVNPLTRLSFIGDRSMGALSYSPILDGTDELEQNSSLTLSALGEESEKIYEGSDAEVTMELHLTGGSPGGARPKATIGLNNDKAISGSTLPEGYEYWLVKFPTGGKKGKRTEGVTEFLYSELARNSGINFLPTRLIQTNNDRYFACQRYDRNNEGHRYHIHSMAGLLNTDFRVPDSDYESLIRLTSQLTKNHEDSEQVVLRMLFNVMTGNRDDHTKNFSFMIDLNGDWRLTPAYDITFNNGINGHHSMSINGEDKDVSLDSLKKIAALAGIKNNQFNQLAEQVADNLNAWSTLANEYDVPKTIKNEIKNYMDKQTSRLVINL